MDQPPNAIRLVAISPFRSIRMRFLLLESDALERPFGSDLGLHSARPSLHPLLNPWVPSLGHWLFQACCGECVQPTPQPELQLLSRHQRKSPCQSVSSNGFVSRRIVSHLVVAFLAACYRVPKCDARVAWRSNNIPRFYRV